MSKPRTERWKHEVDEREILGYPWHAYGDSSRILSYFDSWARKRAAAKRVRIIERETLYTDFDQFKRRVKMWADVLVEDLPEGAAHDCDIPPLYNRRIDLDVDPAK